MSSPARVQGLDYWDLTKPRLVFLVLLSTFVGFFLALEGKMPFLLLFSTLIGTALVAGGSQVLNQWLERREDALMKRTENRPLPAGRVEPVEALTFGAALSILGLGILEFSVNSLTAFLAAVTLVSYLAFYTPLKKKTPFCTIVGAFPGALPPLIGWAAAAGTLSFRAWILFFIMFLWQLPHFLAIAWLYREDYRNAGMKMLSVLDTTGKMTGRQIVMYSAALLPVSLMPTVFQMTGHLYFFGALFLGVWLLFLAIGSVSSIEREARFLFRASIFYLALILILMLLDKKAI